MINPGTEYAEEYPKGLYIKVYSTVCCDKVGMREMGCRGNRDVNCPAQQRHDRRLDGEWIRSKVE